MPAMFRLTGQRRWRGMQSHGGLSAWRWLAGVSAACGGHCPRRVHRSGTLEGKTKCQGDAQDKNKED
jgi:hypothetical protein